MVYTSRPDHYLDPPNWNQPQHRSQLVQQGSQGGGGSARVVAGSTGGEPQLLLPPVPPLPDGGAAAGLVRPNSMAERARLAKIPMPEHALKCPRCDSTNTKFCYFNNYSLSQPRHFCKTCRRYWTRGGALRNVPVGGGCRRNKRSKSSGGSKSSSDDAKTAPGSTPGPSSLGIGGAMPPGLLPTSQLPLLTSLHPLSDYGMPSLGLSYRGIQQLDPIDYPVGNNSVIGLEHWRSLQQFPCFTSLEAVAPTPSPGMYHFNTETGETSAAAASMIAGQIQGKATCAGLITQLASVKMEESNAQGMNLPRQYLGPPGNDHYWGGGGVLVGGGMGGSGAAAWTDLSGISSTSTGSLL